MRVRAELIEVIDVGAGTEDKKQTDSGRGDPVQPWSNFRSRVAARERRRMQALQTKDRSIWLGMGMFGIVGWSIAIPALLGMVVGLWLDARVNSAISWTLALMLAGLTLGLINVWNWMQKTAVDETDESDGDER